jgi:P-type Ca2+ transporter type 2C
MISIYDIMVGDIMHLEVGDIISTDGVLIDGYNIACDESDATGESNAIEKVPANVALSKTAQDISFDKHFDPFIISGAKVLEGVGRFLVTAVGSNSFHGRTLMCTYLLSVSHV